MDNSGAAMTSAAASVQPRRPMRWILIGGALLLMSGIAFGGWAMQLWMQRRAETTAQAPLVSGRNLSSNAVVDLTPAAPARTPPAPAALADPGDLSARVAAIEGRLAAMNMDASNLQGNAMRAEALLIAFAARRALDRGQPLGVVASQLRLRFGDAQPNAVRTVIEAAAAPVTLEKLQGDFDLLAPALAGRTGAASGFWSTAQRELRSLFVLRRADAPATRVEARLDRARRWLDAGLVDRAAREVAALPGTAETKGWLADAQRYHDARRALDLIETAAILAPRVAAESAAPAVVPARP